MRQIDPENRKLHVRLLGNLGLSARATGDTERALQLYEEALLLANRIGDVVASASLQIRLGILALDEGNLMQAARRFDMIISDTRDSKWTQVEYAMALAYRGTVARQQEQYLKAIAYYKQALPLHTRYGYQLEIARVQFGLGVCKLRLGDREEGRTLLSQAKDLFEALNDHNELARIQAYLVE